MPTGEMAHDFTPDTNPIVGVVGLGYVGLPTAIGFHDSGFHVWGCDTSTSVIEALHEQRNPIGDAALDDQIPRTDIDTWNITQSLEELTSNCDIILVTVPTPITPDSKPDLSYVFDAGNKILSLIHI